MNFPIITTELVTSFLLVFLRITTIVIMIPVFGDRAVPMRVKAGLGLLLSLTLFPVVKIHVPPTFMTHSLNATLGMIGEILIGTLIGFAARCIFAAIQAGSEMIGHQIGVSMANLLDPLTSVPVSIISEFLYMIGLLVFLLVDAHHIFITTLTESYHHIPPLSLTVTSGLMCVILKLTANVFWIASKLSAPFVAITILIHIALGVIARTVPQINVFIVGFPIQIAVGLIFLGLAAPFFVMLVSRLFLGLQTDVGTLYNVM